MRLVFAIRLAIAAMRCLVAPMGAGDDPLGPVDQDPDQVQRDACELVAADESVCTPATSPTLPSTSGGGGGAVDLLSMLFWLLLIALVVALVVLVARSSFGRSWARRHRPAKGDGDEIDEDEVERRGVMVDRRREPVGWREEADAHRRAGDFRMALRCRYRALVGDLARRGVIDEIPGRTTGEERAQLQEVRPEVGPPFTAAADLFDGAWYGQLAVDAAADDRFQVLEREVLAGTGQRR